MMSTGPQRLGKYELQTRLERGGMGEVWKAYDAQLRRFVAIKLLHADLQANPDFVARFTREAQFVASLHHPNIVQIHDFQFADTKEAGTIAYMVMDYVEGGTLSNYIGATSRKGLFPPAADIVYLFHAISLALDYAHRRGMIHRDIKPANILLDKRNPKGKALGEPILTDFGIARLQGAAAGNLTATVLGTPRYVSPEQARGLPGDERTDLYSLGIILYEMMAGVTPFQGDNPIAIMMQHLYEMPKPPTLLNPAIPPALSEVILQSIAKDPAERFPTASAMTVALAETLNVPVPTGWSTSQSLSGAFDYNPLQPPNLPPGSDLSSAHLRASLPAPLTQLSEDNIETSIITPVHGMPAPISTAIAREGTRITPLSLAPAEKPRRRRLSGAFVALIACIILLVVIAASTAAWLALQHNTGATNTPNLTGTVVGHIVFISSKGTFDQVEIDLQNIPAPPAGKTYYAWLDIVASSGESAMPHWQLCTVQGVVHCLYAGDTQHSNLLQQNDRFLITEENVGVSLDIPDPIARLYYAELSPNGSATFEVKKCPSSSANNALNPCR